MKKQFSFWLNDYVSAQRFLAGSLLCDESSIENEIKITQFKSYRITIVEFF